MEPHTDHATQKAHATPRILIADNDESLAESIRRRFEHAGYVCDIAYSGAQAVARFQADRTALVITDLAMPSLNGVDFISWVREHSSVPIIVVTGFRDDFDQRLRRTRNLSIFTKPFCMRDLLDVATSEMLLSSPNREAA